MKKKSFRRRAQSMVEMAILGPLLLVAMGIVVTYVAKLNSDQWSLMQAFRNALAKAHSTNKIVSYGTWDDRRQASVTEPIIGSRVTSSGSACVHWSIPSVKGSGQDPQGETYVKINGGIIPFLYEYKVKGDGGIEPRYFTFKNSKLTINTQKDYTRSSRSGGTGEVMIYKVGKSNIFVQGRYSGASRRLSGSQKSRVE
ncbi:MAG: hypothetical protein JSW40_02620 [Candidatus Omnitrophota bacterium]|nr:MAG: hypothetical protein JSW40_02620 [Candidatus Omnitrophota bacterium]